MPGTFSPKDFGKAAADYAAYRKGFPESFFDRLAELGIMRPGQRVLDLGTGTGTLARGFASRGAQATGLDISSELLDQARALARRDSLEVEFIRGRAEKIPLADSSFELVTAGQCWLWFDGEAAAAESRRVLKPGGRLAVAHFSYLAKDGNAAWLTEKLILEHHPRWPLAGSDGLGENWRPHLEGAGFQRIESFYYDQEIPYTHDEWRGRMRTCNGVLALNDRARIQAFDAELGRLLRDSFPVEPLMIPHRVFVISGRK